MEAGSGGQVPQNAPVIRFEVLAPVFPITDNLSMREFRKVLCTAAPLGMLFICASVAIQPAFSSFCLSSPSRYRGAAPIACSPCMQQEAQPSGAAPKDSKHDHTRFGESLKRLKWDPKKGAAVEKGSQNPNSHNGSNAGSHQKPGATDAADSIKLSTTLVALDVLVTDPGGKAITDLDKGDFIISQDGKPESLEMFSKGNATDLPRRIVLLIDWSGSERAYLQSSVAAARTLIGLLTPNDRMAIVTSDVQLMCSMTGDKDKLLKGLDRLLARAASGPRVVSYPSGPEDYRGRSLQFTALMAAMRELITPRDPRQIIIFQTDGDEAPTFRDQPQAGQFIWNMPDRPYGLADIYAAAERRPATIYSIIPSRPLIGLTGQDLLDSTRRMLEESERSRFSTDAAFNNYALSHPISDAKVKMFAETFAGGQNAAAHIAKLTGGWYEFLEKPEDAPAIYSRILADIKRRYTLGYYPDDAGSAPGTRHIKVEVRGHPEYVIHGRDRW